MRSASVMIVDDDADLAESLAEMLVLQGHNVEVASNEYVPFPVIALVRSISTHVPSEIAATEATGLPEISGLVPQITVLSVQSFETRYQSPPRELESVT